jgi:hypothetical protein
VVIYFRVIKIELPDFKIARQIKLREDLNSFCHVIMRELADIMYSQLETFISRKSFNPIAVADYRRTQELLYDFVKQVADSTTFV